MLTKKGTNSPISITGLVSFNDQLISSESNTDKLSFYDLRKPEILLYACSLESDNNPNRKGTSSLKINDSKLVVNNM